MTGIKKFIILIIFAVFAFSIAACNSNPIEETPTGDNIGSFGTYENLKEYLQQYYDESKGSYSLKNNMYSIDATKSVAEGAMNGATNEQPSASFDSSTDRDYSKTNNQVDGVQESDKILTDGFKIYIVSGNKFFIVDAETLNIDYEFEFMNEEGNIDARTYGYLENMYLYDDKIILTSYVYSSWRIEKEDCEVSTCDTNIITPDGDSEDFPGEDKSDDCSYYYDPCVYYEYSYGTKVIVLDVEDTSNVTVSRELYFESAYLVDTRMIDEQIYMVFNNYMLKYGFEEELYVPRYSDSAVSNDLKQLPADKIFFMPSNQESFGYLMLASFDVTSNEEVNVKAYLGSSWQMYMSLNNLYAIINIWTYDEETYEYDYYTNIVRFKIEDGELVYKALARVEGNPLNQFSMDEYDGVFRIATTSYNYSEAKGQIINNLLYCLDATSDDEMTEMSKLVGLGKPGERIYSVRFDEDYAYVVTFEQIDPLIKLDLSNPNNPVILGELEEEGVSDYLHMIDGTNLMIGIGRQMVEEDGWSGLNGVKVSLYDVSSSNPVSLDTYSVEGRYSYTNVMWDHKSFVYFTPVGEDYTLIAVPVYEYFEDFWGYSQSLYIFKVNHSGSLEYLNKLTHMVEVEDGEERYYSYFDTIERAVIIENYIYTVSYSHIKVFDMNDNFKEINSTKLNEDYYFIWGCYLDEGEVSVGAETD